MKDIFDQLGYTVSEDPALPGSTAMEVYYVSNRDGSWRWMWPAHAKRPLFLKFYNVRSFSAALFVLFVKLAFKLRSQGIVFKGKTIYAAKTGSYASGFFIDSQWALFAGTPGPNNKAVMLIRSEGQTGSLKLPLRPAPKRCSKKEYAMAQRLAFSGVTAFAVPKMSVLSHRVLESSDVSGYGERSTRLTPPCTTYRKRKRPE